MSPAAVADEIVTGLRQDKFDIRIGFSDHFYNINKESPEKAFNTFNGIA
jgi:hypothetical protein